MNAKKPPAATKKNIRFLTSLIADGATVKEACADLGISHAKYVSWLRRKPQLRELAFGGSFRVPGRQGDGEILEGDGHRR